MANFKAMEEAKDSIEEEKINSNLESNQDQDLVHPRPCMAENEELESTKAEIGEVIEENQRLRFNLDRMMKDYQALQMRFQELGAPKQQQQPSRSEDEQEQRQLVQSTSTRINNKQIAIAQDDDQLFLSLGGSSSTDLKKKKKKNEDEYPELKRQEALNIEGSGLALSLDSNVHRDHHDEQQPPVKKARVSVRARCDTPTMNDGCQWRKYGQKIAKANPCPRAYYRCTVAPSCPVRKQVQRCVDDMSILITTYEGTHNHPLPLTATAMATTTSAAAYMLTSGSSTTTVANSLSNSDLMSHSFSYGASSQPTITLDLTAAAATSSSSSTSDHFTRLAPATSTSLPPSSSYSYPTIANLTFNSSDLSSRDTAQMGPPRTIIGPGPGPYHDHNSSVAAAARAITSDPTFHSALTAAISSLITGNPSTGSGSEHHNNNNR
ncbi:hypothetical protein V2J09_019479 [Rumex salicifolius]